MALYDVKVTLNKRNVEALKRALQEASEPEIQEALEQWSNYYRAEMRKRYVTLSRGGTYAGQRWKKLSTATIDQRRGGPSKRKAARLKAAAKKQAAAKRKKAKKKPVKAKRPTKASSAKRPRKPITVRNTVKAASKTARKVVKAKVKTVKKKVKTAKAARKKAMREAAANKRVAILRDTGAMFAAFQPYIVKPRGIASRAAKLGLDVRFGKTTKSTKHPNSRLNVNDLMHIHHKGIGRRLPARPLVSPPSYQMAVRMAKRMERALAQVFNKRRS